MKTDRTRTRRLAWALLAGTSALLLTAGLSLVLSRVQALAQPALEVTAANLDVHKYVNRSVAVPGETLAYTITIQNTGDTSTAAWLTDVLPSDLAYVPYSLDANYGTPILAGRVITWSESVGVDQTARIWFSAQISSGTTATQIDNTAQVTGTGQLITYSVPTTVLSGLPPSSQIRSPDMDAIITQKGSLTISGIAWLAGTVPPYLVDDPYLDLERQNDRTYYVRWTAVVSAQDYTLQEATQPDFSDQTSLVLSAPSTQKLISKGAGEDGTYYYRVQASRFGLNPSRWSNVESVVVPWTAASSNLSAPSLSAHVAANDSITVRVRIDDGEWHTAVVTATDWDGWEWSYEWQPLPEENDVQYTIQTQARDLAGNSSAIDAITVTLRNETHIMYFPIFYKRWPPVPYAPTLNDIDNPDEDGNYTVGWSYADGSSDVPDPTYYTLQEATNADFTANRTDYSPISGTSYPFSDKDTGTYYYRVRGHNSYGPGPWSNVKSVTVSPSYYFDDFSDSDSGWPQVKKKVIPETNTYYRLRYDNGQYRIMIDPGGPPIWFHQPDALAPYRPPSDKYCVETRVKIVKGKHPYESWNYYPYWANGGLIFGADEDNTNIYGLCLSVGAGDTLGWFIVNNPVYDYPLKGCNHVDGVKGGEAAGALAIREWHRFQVGVDGDRATVYIDGVYKGSWKMGGLSATTRVGLIGGDYEMNPVDLRFDDFMVTPNATCAP